MELYLKTIDQALIRIRSQQSPDGGFVSLSGFLTDDFSNAIPRRTTFFTSAILACLQNIAGNTTGVQNAAAKFLLSEKSERWSFNYWARRGITQTELPYPSYPDDLDDTFAAIAALARHDRALINGHAFSGIAKMLTAREIKEGGPYRTWLAGDDALAAWQDVDLVVNSTIGYALSLIDVRLPALERFINDAMWRDQLTSPYYPGTFHVVYFLSRFYIHNTAAHNINAQSALASMIIDRLHKDDGRTINTLEYAMTISTLVNLGYAEHIPRTAPNILSDRCEHEGFLPYAFCVDPSRDGKRCYAGSSALTAAFCAEALAKYISSRKIDTSSIPNIIPNIHAHIRSLARMTCRMIDTELRGMASAQIEKVSDKKITGLAYEFRDALYRNGRVIPPDIAEQLSLANLYGWMAYEIYDDIMDGEDVTPLTPCANFFLRSLMQIYQTVATDAPEIATLFEHTMNRIDNANAWEQRYCRINMNGVLPCNLPPFGDHANLADRSIGHAMGPLAQLLYAGYAANSAEYKNVELFFRHYLIARQLHDDAHDWADDLLRGRVNSVSVSVLHRFKEKYPTEIATAKTDIALPALRKIFWEEIIDDIADLIYSHIAKARRAREASQILVGDDFMESTLRSLESGACRAARERNETLIFLKEYVGYRPPGVTP